MRPSSTPWWLTGLAFALSACVRPAPVPDAGASAAPRADVAAVAAQPPATAALPASGFEHVPGWLAFTAQPLEARTQPWTPLHAGASVAILDAEAWSQAVAPGTRFRLVSREGTLPLTLSGVSVVPYGCDGIGNTMAQFAAPRALDEQLAWILPEGEERASAVPLVAGAESRRQRNWTVASLAITTQLDRADAGQLEVRRGGERLLVVPFEVPAMDDADGAATDLTRDHEVGVPYPEAAFRLGGDLMIVVLRTMSYEGVTFEVLALRDSLERAGSRYVYLCAF